VTDFMGIDVLFLATTGARTGRRREIPSPDSATARTPGSYQAKTDRLLPVPAN